LSDRWRLTALVCLGGPVCGSSALTKDGGSGALLFGLTSGGIVSMVAGMIIGGGEEAVYIAG